MSTTRFATLETRRRHFVTPPRRNLSTSARDMQTRRRSTARARFSHDDTASTFLSETSTASETTVGESEHAIHPKRAESDVLRDSQNGGCVDRPHCITTRYATAAVAPAVAACAWVTSWAWTDVLTYALMVGPAHACAQVFQKTCDRDYRILSRTSYVVGATCVGAVSGSWFSPRPHSATIAPSSIAYLVYSALAWASTPTWGLSSSDKFFGSKSDSVYAQVISYYNMDTMGWNLIYHTHLVLSGAHMGVVFIVQIVSSVYQIVLATSQKGSLAREDMHNCKFMCTAVLIMTFIDMDRMDYTSSGFQFPEWTPSLAIHAMYLLPMHVFDPIWAMFDFVQSGADREELGLYKPSARHSMSWLVAYMTNEFVYMAANSLSPTASVNTMDIVKDVCKLGCIFRTTTFLWEQETRAGIFPQLTGYVIAFFTHGAVKIFTITSKYYLSVGLDIRTSLFYTGCLYTLIVLRIAPLRDSG